LQGNPAISVKIQNYQIAPYMKLKKDIEIILPYFCFVFGTRSLKNDIQTCFYPKFIGKSQKT
jgi:hypothetical protein